MSEEKNPDRVWIYILSAIFILIFLIISASMINITVLDTQPLQNITLQVNIS